MIEKCSQYWPEKVGHTIRLHRTGMMITLKESKLFADYTINTLSLKQVLKGDMGKVFFAILCVCFIGRKYFQYTVFREFITMYSIIFC